ncbi:hypothetical protein [Geobacillus sp. Y412MC52]|uniref:hypothetical protein n=1 Tax=Geobacillus sp. (strain Y412MC52) TaxID=550542 RepID=UPI000A00D476
MAALVNNKAELLLNDAIKPRLLRFREVCAIYRCFVTEITNYPGQYIDKFVTRQFDRILLDVQCSGEGRIDLRRPRALRFWSEHRIRKFSRLQKKMLISSFKLLRPGEILVYSTCTFAPEEKEEPVDYLLRNYPARVEEIQIEVRSQSGLTLWGEKKYHPDLSKALRVLPSE